MDAESEDGRRQSSQGPGITNCEVQGKTERSK